MPSSSPSGEARAASCDLECRSFSATAPPASSRSSRPTPSALPSGSSRSRSSCRPRGSNRSSARPCLSSALAACSARRIKPARGPVERGGRVAQRTVMANRDDQGAVLRQARRLRSDLHPRPPLMHQRAWRRGAAGHGPTIPAQLEPGLSTLRHCHGRWPAAVTRTACLARHRDDRDGPVPMSQTSSAADRRRRPHSPRRCSFATAAALAQAPGPELARARRPRC